MRLSPCFAPCTYGTPFLHCHRNGNARRTGLKALHTTRKSRSPCGPRLSLDTDNQYSSVLKHGIDAAIEDYVKSGMNICVGGGKTDEAKRLLDALATMTEVEGLVDVGFASTSGDNSLLLDRGLPTDFSVNFKKGIDLFIAPISVMDDKCNAVFDSHCFAADKLAASVAAQVVFIIHESNLDKFKSGIQSTPVQLMDFQIEQAPDLLCSTALLDLGIRGVTLRGGDSSIADVSLSPSAFPYAVESELRKLPSVLSTGLFPACMKTTAVVATHDLDPFDKTPGLHHMASLNEKQRNSPLDGKMREQALRRLNADWEVAKQENESLRKEFLFASPFRAEAFVQYIQYISRETRHYPEISYSSCSVTISISTNRAKGITELDATLATELSAAYRQLRAFGSTGFT